MATKYSKANLIGDEGVDYVALVCSRAGALFLGRPRQDVGIDGHIEFLSATGEPTGQLALVQCKAGTSYISQTGAYTLRAGKAHFETWSRYRLPVVGIVYNPSARDARWVDLSAHLREHPSCVSSGPFSVEAPPHQVFSEGSFNQLRNHLGLDAEDSSDVELVERYLSDASDAAREEAITTLFAQRRWSPHCCFVIHAALLAERSDRLMRLLVYLRSFYTGHPDRFYSAANTMPSPVREELESIASLWGRRLDEPQIVRILKAIDPDGGLDRGSFGQLAVILLAEVDEVQRKLERIASTRSHRPDVRRYAIGILVELDLARRPFLARLTRQETDPLTIEVLRWALDVTR